MDNSLNEKEIYEEAIKILGNDRAPKMFGENHTEVIEKYKIFESARFEYHRTQVYKSKLFEILYSYLNSEMGSLGLSGYPHEVPIVLFYSTPFMNYPTMLPIKEISVRKEKEVFKLKHYWYDEREILPYKNAYPLKGLAHKTIDKVNDYRKKFIEIRCRIIKNLLSKSNHDKYSEWNIVYEQLNRYYSKEGIDVFLKMDDYYSETPNQIPTVGKRSIVINLPTAGSLTWHICYCKNAVIKRYIDDLPKEQKDIFNQESYFTVIKEMKQKTVDDILDHIQYIREDIWERIRDDLQNMTHSREEPDIVLDLDLIELKLTGKITKSEKELEVKYNVKTLTVYIGDDIYPLPPNAFQITSRLIDLYREYPGEWFKKREIYSFYRTELAPPIEYFRKNEKAKQFHKKYIDVNQDKGEYRLNPRSD